MSSLPAATVTYLCGDFGRSLPPHQVGGGSPPEAMAQLLALLGRVAEAHGGELLAAAPQQGVAAATFPVAGAAIAAACSAWTALHTAAAGARQMPAVRWALHTGPAARGEQAVAGSAWRRCRYLLAAGHPGQALLSLVTAELCRDALPIGAALRELGLFRLRDLSRPEMVYLPHACPVPRPAKECRHVGSAHRDCHLPLR